jgi:polar amino acid transport system permease protein
MATETVEQVRPEEIKAIPVRHPGRWVATAILLFLVVALVNSMVQNQRFEWGIIGHWLFSRRIIDGAVVTIEKKEKNIK